MKNQPEILWNFEDHDYEAAESYLRLIYDDILIKKIINRLREANIVEFKAKDIFRASQLSLLGISNSHVEKDLKKIKKHKTLSPILLVRQQVLGKVLIADG